MKIPKYFIFSYVNTNEFHFNAVLKSHYLFLCGSCALTRHFAYLDTRWSIFSAVLVLKLDASDGDSWRFEETVSDRSNMDV